MHTARSAHSLSGFANSEAYVREMGGLMRACVQDGIVPEWLGHLEQVAIPWVSSGRPLTPGTEGRGCPHPPPGRGDGIVPVAISGTGGGGLVPVVISGKRGTFRFKVNLKKAAAQLEASERDGTDKST